MKTLHCDQKSAEWLAAREKCLTTASGMGLWLTKNDQRSKDARIARISALIAKRVPKDAWQIQKEQQEEDRMKYNLPVERGNAFEAQAREVYEMLTGCKVEQVGLCLTSDDLFGASPDGVIYETTPSGDPVGNPKHGLEIKCPWPDTHVEYLLAGTLPDEYRCQVHGSMAVTGLNRWDFLSHCPGWPPLLIQVERDQFTADLEKGLALFAAEYRERCAEMDQRAAAFEATRIKLAAMWANREDAA